MSRLEGHRSADRRSLAYHRAIAEKLLVEDSVLLRARARVADWEKEPSSRPYATRWAEKLALPLAELARFLNDDSQDARDLRQASPFAGALTPQERWALWNEHR